MRDLGNGKIVIDNKVWFGQTRVVKPDPITAIFTRFTIDKNDCWIWNGAVHRDGYAKYDIMGKTKSVHRFLYETFFGPIAKGLNYCHTCDVKLCINPAHAFIGTHQDNSNDMKKKGRSLAGERNHKAKVTSDDVLKIRELREKGSTYESIGKVFGLTKSGVYSICKKRIWKTLSGETT